MTTLHPIRGYNTYCGPAVLAAILGITTDEAAKRVREVNPRKQKVKGVSNYDILTVLERAGWRLVRIPPFTRSVKSLIRDWRHYSTGMYLINITDHYIVARRKDTLYSIDQRWDFVDNHYKTPKSLAAVHQWTTKRIQKMWYLVPPEAGSLPAARTAQQAEDERMAARAGA